MNCIPAFRTRYSLLLAVLPPVIACALPLSAVAASADEASTTYRVEFVVEPAGDGARVELQLQQDRYLLREVDMRAPLQGFFDFDGDGEISRSGERLVWRPPEDGGSLRWMAKVDSPRGTSTFDAHIDRDWAVFRAEDVIPAAATRTLKGSASETWLRFELPLGWSSVTQYFGRDNRYRIDNPARRFDRPTGWIALGDLGVRTETIAGIRTKVAGPVGHAVRRMDVLALLQWTLPELVKIVPDFPDRLTVVSAGRPMWRGGLSAPQSLFVHADLPLINENSTSTLLHETVHVGLGVRPDTSADWIVEGLAEYLSLRLLLTSGTISTRRFGRALDMQTEWGADVTTLCTDRSSGAITARGVTIMHELDTEILTATGHERNLDDVVSALAVAGGDMTVAVFREAAESVAGTTLQALEAENLPGCHD